MSTKQFAGDVPAVQAAIYRVALFLDAFLLNGLQYGVLQRAVFPAFLEKASGNLLRDLAGLEEQAPGGSQRKVTEVLAALRAKCRQLIELVSGLSSFRTLPLQEVRVRVSQILLLREECVQRIQELEDCFRTPKPFYPVHPADSTTAVTEYLGNLERVLAEEWAATERNRGHS
jgi:hypothetical protein